LTERGAPSWHPATANDRAVVARAADFCRDAGTSIEQLAFQFACQRAPVATTLFSAADPATVVRNIAWAETPFDPDLVAAVRAMLAPIIDRDWY
jgi:aryl-alcohol dehydrogenase-like predicted oxidoreductase